MSKLKPRWDVHFQVFGICRRAGVVTMVRTIYQQLSPAEVHGQLDRVVERLLEPFSRWPRCWWARCWPSGMTNGPKPAKRRDGVRTRCVT